MSLRKSETKGDKEMSKSFEEWMEEVDDEMDNIVGLTSLDIEDYDYYSDWDSGVSIKRAAMCALRNCGWTN